MNIKIKNLQFSKEREEITKEEEKQFGQGSFCWIEEEIIGAVEALRAAGVNDDEIVKYIVEKWGISKGYAWNYMEDSEDFKDRVGEFFVIEIQPEGIHLGAHKCAHQKSKRNLLMLFKLWFRRANTH